MHVETHTRGARVGARSAAQGLRPGLLAMKMHQHNAAYALVLLPPITLLNPLRCTSKARRREFHKRNTTQSSTVLARTVCRMCVIVAIALRVPCAHALRTCKQLCACFYRHSANSRSAARWRNVEDTSVTVVSSNSGVAIVVGPTHQRST